MLDCRVWAMRVMSVWHAPLARPVDAVGHHLAMEQELNRGPEGEGWPGVRLLSNVAPVYCEVVSIGCHISALQQLLSGDLAGQVRYATEWSVGNACSRSLMCVCTECGCKWIGPVPVTKVVIIIMVMHECPLASGC